MKTKSVKKIVLGTILLLAAFSFIPVVDGAPPGAPPEGSYSSVAIVSSRLNGWEHLWFQLTADATLRYAGDLPYLINCRAFVSIIDWFDWWIFDDHFNLYITSGQTTYQYYMGRIIQYTYTIGLRIVKENTEYYKDFYISASLSHSTTGSIAWDFNHHDDLPGNWEHRVYAREYDLTIFITTEQDWPEGTFPLRT